MAKPKKTFTPREIAWVCGYIDRKFKLDLYWPQDDSDLQFGAQASFQGVRNNGESAPLQAWCDQWLNDEQRNQLLAALRAWKKRDVAIVPKKTVTLDRNAWLYLSAIARRNNVTISQFLIDRLEAEYLHLDNDEIGT